MKKNFSINKEKDFIKKMINEFATDTNVDVKNEREERKTISKEIDQYLAMNNILDDDVEAYDEAREMMESEEE